MSWVCGTAATSALDPQAGLRRPGTVFYTFLNQPQQTAYFRAFTNDNLGSTVFTDVAEQHLRRATEDAGWPSESRHDAPVFIDLSSYTVAEYENRRRAGNTDVGEHDLLYLTEDLYRRSGSRRIFSLATACTSPVHALIQVDNCLRGGAERAFILDIENLNRLILLHFHSLGLFTEHYRPFGDSGLILGEDIAALALPAAPPDCTDRLKLVGHAINTGNNLIQNNSKALEQVIHHALNIAAVLPENIATVKTHDIGAADNDAAGLAALENVFGTLPPLMASRAQIGHALGAAAALETVLLLSALKQGGGTDYQGREIHSSDDVFCFANHFDFDGNNTAMVQQWQS